MNEPFIAVLLVLGGLADAASDGLLHRHGRSSIANNNNNPKEIHLAGIFPINGVEGWQGGQVKNQNKLPPEPVNFCKHILTSQEKESTRDGKVWS